MLFFRSKYPSRAVFLMVSDDMKWARTHIANTRKDLFFVGTNDNDSAESVSLDLATLAACNHTVISRGSFGAWASKLAGGTTYSPEGIASKDNFVKHTRVL